MSVRRTRNFATVIYPDSAPGNFLEIIGELKIPCFISPLHDQDVNPDGELKKPHWHCMFMFEGVKTEAQVREIFDTFNGVGLEIVNSLRGYARYLCHLDNPEKYQYNVDNVTMYGGADYFNVIGLASDKYKAVSEMMDFIQDEDIMYFWDLLEYSRIHRNDWFKLLCDNSAYIVKEAIFSYIRKRKGLNDFCRDE